MPLVLPIHVSIKSIKSYPINLSQCNKTLKSENDVVFIIFRKIIQIYIGCFTT